MKFTIDSKTFLHHLSAVGKVVNNKSVNALKNFHFELNDGKLSITGSDSESTLVAHVALTFSEGDGTFCLEAKRLLDLVKNAPTGPLDVTVQDDLQVIIKYMRGKYTMTAINGCEYPTSIVRAQDEEARFTISTQTLLSALDKVSFAASTDEFRVNMQGVYWDVKPESLTFVATDTRVLAKYRTTKHQTGMECGFTLHSRAISLLRGLVNKESEVTVTVTPTLLTFSTPTSEMQTVKVHGKFPDYNRVIPTNNPVSAMIDRLDLQGAVARLSVCADATMNNAVKLNFTGDKLNISAQDVGFGTSGSEHLPANVSGGGITISFNADYLKQVLGAVISQNVTLKLADGMRPALFIPAEQEEHAELTLLLMPVSQYE